MPKVCGFDVLTLFPLFVFPGRGTVGERVFSKWERLEIVFPIPIPLLSGVGIDFGPG